MSKYCMACEVLITGRSDKKFCGYNCRSEFNNQLNKDKNLFMRKINKILNRNKLILGRLYARENLAPTTSILIAAGFDFRYYTHQERLKEGPLYTFCYEYGYLNIGKEEVLLKKIGDREE